MSKRQKAGEVAAQKNLETEKKFDAAIGAAGEITDPTKKVLTLVKIGQDISAEIQSKGGSIHQAAVRERNKLAIPGGGAALAGGAAASMLLGPLAWVSLGVIGGGFAVTGLVSRQRRKSVEKNLQRESLGHMERMENKGELVSEMLGEVVSKNVKEISKSPEYKHILTLPGIVDKFAHAAQKHLSVDPPPAPSPVIEVRQPKPPVQRPSDSKPTYDDRIKKRL